MESSRDFVITKREALNMLGVRKNLLAQLECLAEVSDIPGRDGYTELELKRLLAQLGKILGR